MIINQQLITSAFDDLLSGARRRDEIANWASALMKANDNRQVEFDPVGQKARLWKAVKYLSGVDLQASPGEYLHDASDFTKFRKEVEC